MPIDYTADENHRKVHSGRYSDDPANHDPESLDFTPSQEENVAMTAQRKKLDKATEESPAAESARKLRDKTRKALEDLGE